jgi:hypothetical protein
VLSDLASGVAGHFAWPYAPFVSDRGINSKMRAVVSLGAACAPNS